MSIAMTNNDPVFAGTLTRLRLTNTTVGLGPIGNLDTELGTCRLYRDNGNGVLDGADVLLAQASASAGAVVFQPLSQNLAAMATVNFIVVSNTPLTARDADALDLAIQSSADVSINPAGLLGSTYPIAPAGSFPIDGMVAAQIGLGAPAANEAPAGAINAFALDVHLPANGYETDQLQQLALVNLGTAAPSSDISAIKAWVDDGDGLFDPSHDRLLGALGYTGARWQLASLAESVPVAGVRVFFSVDVSSQATLGRTIRLALPALPDPGVDMASADDGPIDVAVANASVQTIVAAPTVIWSSSGSAAVAVTPGQAGVLLGRFHASSTYGATRTLTRLAIGNATVGPGNAADHDAQVQLVTLRADANRSGTLDGTDPVIGTASFVSASAVFSGLSWTIPADSSGDLFVVGDVSMTATDGDTLAVKIVGPGDVGFLESTNATAAWPVVSGMRSGVDGMIAAQIGVPGMPTQGVAPGEGPVLAMSLVVPRNGRVDDALQSVRVDNLGTAQAADLTELRLWRDGGNGVFDAGSGDDVNLGVLAPAGPEWVSGALNEGLGASGDLLFVSATVAAGAPDSTTLHLGVPVSGLQVASGNDGPIDHAIAGGGSILIIRSALLASLDARPTRISVGQDVAIHMLARNAGSEGVNGITPSTPQPTGGASLSWISGPTPASLDLAPGASDTLRWVYRATGSGSVSLSANAQGVGASSATTIRSLAASSQSIRVDRVVPALDYSGSSTLPSVVNRGQSDVAALLLTFANQSDPEAASVRIRGLRVTLADGAGGGIVPAQLFDRVVVGSGSQTYLVKTALESAGSTLDLTFATPPVVAAGQSLALTVRGDISPSTSASDFRLRLDDSTAVVLDDANSGLAVAAGLQGGAYPVVTSLARIVSAATELDAAAAAAPAFTVGQGQLDRPLLTVHLQSPGVSGVTSDVEVLGLTIALTDSTGAPAANLSEEFSRLVVRSPTMTVASHTVLAGDGAAVTLSLSPPVRVPANALVDVELRGDMAVAAQTGAIRIQLNDSSSVQARDANSQAAVPVRLATRPLAGPVLVVQSPAETLLARATGGFAAHTAIGATGVVAWTMRLANGGPASSASMRVDGMTVHSRDLSGAPLAPGTTMARLRVLRQGVEIGSAPSPPSAGDATAIPLNLLLAPGDSVALQLQADIAASAPAGSLQLLAFAADLAAHDANLGTPVAVGPAHGDTLPCASGVTLLDAPARDLRASWTSRLPAVIVGDGQSIAVGSLTLRNAAAAGSGAIQVHHLTLMGGDRARSPMAVGQVFSVVEATLNGLPWATSGMLTPDSIWTTLTTAQPLDIPSATSVTLELQATPRLGASGGSVRLGIDSTGIAVTQPQSALLTVQVLPEQGQSFPFWSESAELGAVSLAGSFTNFPNPFAAGREATTLGYFLPGPARVTVRIYTVGGDVVRTLLDGVSQLAGMHQNDSWDGRNGAGQTIRNGVYVAELVARYDDGRHERLVRKVAVVR